MRNVSYSSHSYTTVDTRLDNLVTTNTRDWGAENGQTHVSDYITRSMWTISYTCQMPEMGNRVPLMCTHSGMVGCIHFLRNSNPGSFDGNLSFAQHKPQIKGMACSSSPMPSRKSLKYGWCHTRHRQLMVLGEDSFQKKWINQLQGVPTIHT